jgi:hypothetical protein
MSLEAAPETTTTAPPTPAPRWAKLMVLVVAILGALGALSSIAVLFGDWSEVPGPGLGGAVMAASIIVRPPLAIAAVIFASRNDLRRAVMAIAGLVLANSLSFLPSAVEYGFNVTDAGFYGMVAAAQTLLYPVLAVVALVLAWRNTRLIVAAVLVCLPMFVDAIGIAMFAVGVAIYGF